MAGTALNWKKTILVVVLATLFWLSMQLVNPVYADVNPSNAANLVLVKFQPGVSAAERGNLVKEMGGEMVLWIDAISTAQIRLPENWASVRSGQDAMSMARSSSLVQVAEFDSVVSGVPIEMESEPQVNNSTIPTSPIQVNDADFNNPQMQVYALGMIQLLMAFNYTTGSKNIKIAILDSGILASHPEFDGRLLPGYDFVNDDADPHDDYGHGTHVAGIAAAGVNNGIGMIGVCPGCSIIPVKVLNQSNQGTWAGVAAGIVFAVDAGANVINLSLGGTSIAQAVEDAVRYATDKNVLVVAAAGNARSNAPFYPAALEDVVGVAATRNDDTRWSLSNYGYFVELSAPGYAIYSTYNNMDNAYRGYNYMSGTSMASPHVAGLAALLLSQNPQLKVAELRSLMRSTATDLGDPGRDDYFGYGRIDAFAALQANVPAPQPNAAVGGSVWNDVNVNGQWEQSEQSVEGVLSIRLMNSRSEEIASATPNKSGQWRIANLYPGSYKIVAKVLGNTVLTTAGTYNVSLENAQDMQGLNFGTIQADPSTMSFQVFVPTVQGSR